MRCALTGHRDLPASFDKNKLYDFLEESITEKGCDVFYCGMAEGFDLLALDCLVSLARKYPIKLVACIPYEGHERRLCEADKAEYLRLLEWCDEKVVLYPHCYNGCFHTRDRYMVDNAEYVIAYCTKPKGGTAYTVRYAKSKGLDVDFFTL